MKLAMLLSFILFVFVLTIGIIFNNKPINATGLLFIFIWMFVMEVKEKEFYYNQC